MANLTRKFLPGQSEIPDVATVIRRLSAMKQSKKREDIFPRRVEPGGLWPNTVLTVGNQ